MSICIIFIIFYPVVNALDYSPCEKINKYENYEECNKINNKIDKEIYQLAYNLRKYGCNDISYIWKKIMLWGETYFCDIEKISSTYLWEKLLNSYTTIGKCSEVKKNI